MIDTVFFQQNRHDATLAFSSGADPSVVQDIAAWPGVLKAEPFRDTSVLIRHEHKQKRLSIVGMPAGADLSRILDHRLIPMDASPSGLTLSEEVAAKLGVVMGDQVQVTLLEAGDRIADLTVTGISKEFIGLPVYMRLAALNELLPGGPRVSGVRVSINADELPTLYQRVKASPVIQTIALMRISLVNFREMIDQNILIMASLYCALAIVITFGVIYNSARIQLSERARELASLRVFGFTRTEVSSVLLLELSVIVLAAQPLGWLLGYGFSWLVSRGFALDPPFLDRRTEAELDAAVAAGRFAIELAEAERERAQSAKNLAQAEYQRANTLSASSSISQSALERALSELQLATAQLKNSDATVRLREAELASIEAKLIQPRTDEGKYAMGSTCCVDIAAPIDGVILSMVTRSEQAVNTGTLIAEIGNPDDLETRVDLLSSDAVRVNAGSRVSFSDWGGDQVLTGTVSRIEPAAFTHVSALGIEEQRVNLIMEIDNVPKGLGHGFRVFARITVWNADDIVQVPISALDSGVSLHMTARWHVARASALAI